MKKQVKTIEEFLNENKEVYKLNEGLKTIDVMVFNDNSITQINVGKFLSDNQIELSFNNNRDKFYFTIEDCQKLIKGLQSAIKAV